MAEKDDYLVDILTDLGFVSPDKVAELRPEAQSAGVGLVDLMLANKLVRPEDVTQAKAAHFGAEVVNLNDVKISDEVIAMIPRHIARKYRVVPVFRHENSLTVALADPSDLDTIDSLTHLLHLEINLQVASEADIEDHQNVELLEGNKHLTEGNQQILKQVESLEQRILELETNILARLDGKQPA